MIRGNDDVAASEHILKRSFRTDGQDSVYLHPEIKNKSHDDDDDDDDGSSS